MYLENLILSNTVIVFSKSYCPYCVKTKELFERGNVKYTAIELDKERDGA